MLNMTRQINFDDGIEVSATIGDFWFDRGELQLQPDNIPAEADRREDDLPDDTHQSGSGSSFFDSGKSVWRLIATVALTLFFVALLSGGSYGMVTYHASKSISTKDNCYDLVRPSGGGNHGHGKGNAQQIKPELFMTKSKSKSSTSLSLIHISEPTRPY